MFVHMDFWARRTVSPLDGREGWTVVDDAFIEHPRAAEYLRVLLDGEGRSIGTARTYAGRLALYLTWAARCGLDETRPRAEDLGAFARWLERTPSRKHRPGRNRRRAADPNVVSLTPARSAGTVDGILTVVVEFVRFLASRGWTDVAVAGALSTRHELRFLPQGFDRGERSARPVINRRLVRRRRVERPPMTLTREEVVALVEACRNARDRFIVECLYATGLRVSELCGLRLSDLHFVPSAVHLGCKAAGAHLHVVRREDNENRALAKSIYPRVVPVARELVWHHNAYRSDRDRVPEAAESDYMLVNLYRAPLGRALAPGSVEQLFVRLSGEVGLRARPHMLRHSFASEVALATKDPALVKELLGHASVASTDVYMHARWADMRAAIDGHARRGGQAMSPQPAPALPAPTQPAEDRRLRVMRSLVVEDWLPGEWDPVRLLLIPIPGGVLTRRLPCLVPACPTPRVGVIGLCAGHTNQFGHSDEPNVESWIVAGGQEPLRRRLCQEDCAVSDDGGNRCPRPASGRWGMCVAHATTWKHHLARGSNLEDFLAGARPLPSFGDCMAACCYQVAAHGLGLCMMHYRCWIVDGSPRGRALEQWRRRVRQPSNSKVLSLRGLPELVGLEVLYAIQRRVSEQVRTAPENMSGFVNLLRAAEVASVLDFDLTGVDAEHNRDHGRFARYVLDRVALAYRDPEVEFDADRWDLRVLGRRGHLDFSSIRQDWLRQGTKRWAAATMGRLKDGPTTQVRVRAIGVLSQVLASGPGGGHDPAELGRRDVDRFLLRLHTLRSPRTGEVLSASSAISVLKGCGLVLREATEMGFLPGLSPTFSLRRGDARWPVTDEELGRALPTHVVAQLDAQLDLLRRIPGSTGGPSHRSLGVLGERAGDVAVLAYRLLKGTGRRLGEIASLRLECLDVDEHAKAVLVYDNHKAGRLRRRLPLADSGLVEALRDQQRWVAERFPDTPRERLSLLPKPNKNADGTSPISSNQLYNWIRAWVVAIPTLDAGPTGHDGEPVPFDRTGIIPHAFRHTYAQTLADEGVAPSVLRDLMDHRNMNTTLGYYRVNEKKKRQAMELVARHTVDNRGTIRPVADTPTRVSELREELSWVAVPMGKCSEPTNVHAGGQACPIRYQCAGCPHFESDPSYLPELRTYADDLRREREMLLALGAAKWVVDNVAGQLEVIVDHVRRHEQLLKGLSSEQRGAVEEASRTVRKARQSVPVAFGRRQREVGDG